MPPRASLLPFALAVALASACRPSVSPATLDARTLHPGGDAASPIRATYFPPATARARSRRTPLLLVEPILFRRELLTSGSEGGLVGFLEGEGFPVWLVWSEDPATEDGAALGRGVAAAAASIARETGARELDLVGLSLGAEGALRALEPLTAPGAPVAIRRVAFLGGGFDFAYPHSFSARIANLRGASATALCSLDGDVGCAREFRHSDVAAPWLGFVPPAQDPVAPARQRFAFVRRFTRLPVLFVNGKADGIAPSESMFPLYTLWGSDEPDPRRVPKLLFLAGHENALGADLDHFDLLAGDRGTAVWSHLASWLKQDD